MNRYTFKFTPAETFFFGSEKHILNESEEPVANYFVESCDYPQQTTLLGAIRFYILQQQGKNIFDNQRIQDKKAAAAKIGDSSFIYQKEAQEFGIINQLGFLYWMDAAGKKYFPYYLKKGVILDEKGNLLNENGEPYDAKNQADYMGLQLRHESDDPISLDTVIKNKVIVGNKKSDPGEDNKEGFYKQNQKYMKEGWAFAVDVELSEALEESTLKYPGFISLGGEKSIFKLEIMQTETLFEAKLPADQMAWSSIHLVSDTFISPEILSGAAFGITEYVSFRNLISTVSDTEDYRGLSDKNKKQLRRSSRLNLLRRGSLLFFKDTKALDMVVEKIEEEKNARKIGFNQIIISKK